MDFKLVSKNALPIVMFTAYALHTLLVYGIYFAYTTRSS